METFLPDVQKRLTRSIRSSCVTNIEFILYHVAGKGGAKYPLKNMTPIFPCSMEPAHELSEGDVKTLSVKNC